MRGFRLPVRMSCIASTTIAAAIACSAHAGVTLQAAGVSSNMGDGWLSIDRIIDQNGLNQNYVSGVTDFDTFVASTTHYSGYYTTWLSGGPLTGNVDFDLGSAHTIDGMALWANGQPAGVVLEYVRDFQLYVSNDASFTSSTLLGTFTLNTTWGNDNDPGHAFSFAAVTTQYVRMVILSNNGANWTTAIDETVFSMVVPAPGAAALLGISGLTAIRRRRASHQ